MKKIVGLLVVIVVLAIGTASAAERVNPKVVFLFSDTLTGSLGERQEAKQEFINKLAQNFATKYNVSIDGGFSQRLAEAGFNEPILAERADLVPIFKDGGANYVIIAYADDYVYNTRGGYNMPEYVFNLRLKVIDVDLNKYLFDGRFYLSQKKSTLTKEYLGELCMQAEKTLNKVMQ